MSQTRTQNQVPGEDSQALTQSLLQETERAPRPPSTSEPCAEGPEGLDRLPKPSSRRGVSVAPWWAME